MWCRECKASVRRMVRRNEYIPRKRETVIWECAQCGIAVASVPSKVKRFCSRGCWRGSLIKTRAAVCEVCATAFTRERRQLAKRGMPRTCSKQCALVLSFVGKACVLHWRECAWCLLSFCSRRRRFCSQRCGLRFHSVSANLRRPNRKAAEAPCIVCGDPVAQTAGGKGARRYYCGRPCENDAAAIRNALGLQRGEIERIPDELKQTAIMWRRLNQEGQRLWQRSA